MLTPSESIDDFKEVTASEKTAIEAADAKWEEPSEEFIAQVEAAGAVYNRKTGYFELNGLDDLTTAQMRDIMILDNLTAKTVEHSSFKYLTAPGAAKVRTLFPFRVYIANFEWILGYQEKIEKIVVSHYLDYAQAAELTKYDYCFENCKSLKEVEGIMDVRRCREGEWTTTNLPLESIKLIISTNMRFNKFPELSLTSISYMVANAANTSPITITLHPQAYARVTDELFALAAEKNITIAST